jgi:nucleotide-binding universal stress UspA family protein
MFTSTLVGVDGTWTGRDAIALAENLRDSNGHMTLAHVVLAQTPVYANFPSTPVGQHTREMLQGEAAAAGVSAQFTGMFAPSVGWGLHQLAADNDADLLVVGTSHRGRIDVLISGDGTRSSLSGAPRAVAVAPLGYADQPRQIETIGVAYNGSPESERALATARVLAARYGAALKALAIVTPRLRVVRPSGQKSPLRWATMTAERDVSERLGEMTGVDGRVTVGSPADELVRFGDQVDLLVIAPDGSGPIRRLLFGDIALHLARSARCPLLVLPRRVPPAHGSIETVTADS